MTGDAMETYYHRVSCRPFWCLAAKGGELGICLRSCVGVCVGVFVFVSRVRCVRFFRSLSFGCEPDHMVYDICELPYPIYFSVKYYVIL